MRRRHATFLLIAALGLVSGCSGDDDADASGVARAAGATDDTTDDATDGEAVAASGAGASGSSSDAPPPATDESAPVDAPTGPGTYDIVDVPESGVPGIDSADAFCAAWSRFGGTWQVVQVAAAFAPDPSVVPAMEVAASPVVAAAYDTMFAAWPDELAGEREIVADGFFGPLRRRADVALDALVAAGATEADMAAIGDAWVAALAARARDEPVVVPALDDDLAALVAAAAATLDATLVGIGDDPSMHIVVVTPLTDRYLATGCPDQGSLLGGEVADGG